MLGEAGRRLLARSPHDDLDAALRPRRGGVERDPDRRVHRGKPEALGHHAADGVRIGPDPDPRADHISTPIQEETPDAIAHDRGPRSVAKRILCKGPPQRGIHAERRKKVRRHAPDAHAFAPIVGSHLAELFRRDGGHGLAEIGAPDRVQSSSHRTADGADGMLG
jgi:hypothetical protein